MRKLFVISITGANEISGYAFAIAGALAAAFALLDRAHTRIDAAYRFLSHRTRILLDFLALLCILGFIGFLTLRVALVLSESFRLGARSNTPLEVSLWIPQSLWLLGLLVTWFVGFILFVRSVRAFRSNDLGTVTHMIGIGAADEAEQ